LHRTLAEAAGSQKHAAVIILQRARDTDVCPKVMHLDTESDVWQARASLAAKRRRPGPERNP